MLFASLERTFPESQRSGWSSPTAVDATRTSYAVCCAAGELGGPSAVRLQARLGDVSPRPTGSVSVSTRSDVGLIDDGPTMGGGPSADAGATDAKVAPDTANTTSTRT